MKLYKNGYTVTLTFQYEDKTTQTIQKTCPNRKAAEKQLGFFLGWYSAKGRPVLSSNIEKEA